MKLNKQFFKPRKNLKNRVIKKVPFTVYCEYVYSDKAEISTMNTNVLNLIILV